MSDFEENDDFMCDDEEDYGLVRALNSMSMYFQPHSSMNDIDCLSSCVLDE